MRQDKDRGSKWLLTHHGNAILKLGGITGFTHWQAIQAETVAPRRLPDALLEVRFPGEETPTLVLVEIETYPDNDADRQVFDDLKLIAVERKVVPEVISMVLKPKGHLVVTGQAEQVSRRGSTRMTGSWPVVRLWELEADTLFAANDVGLIPWVPLTKTNLPPDELMKRCRDRLLAVPDQTDKAGLIAVTQILAGLAFPDRRFLDLFGGAEMMIESPVLDEVKEILRKRYEAEFMAAGMAKGMAEGIAKGLAQGMAQAMRENVIAALETRFGSIPADKLSPLNLINDETKLRELHRLAITCADVDTFVAALAASKGV